MIKQLYLVELDFAPACSNWHYNMTQLSYCDIGLQIKIILNFVFSNDIPIPWPKLYKQTHTNYKAGCTVCQLESFYV